MVMYKKCGGSQSITCMGYITWIKLIANNKRRKDNNSLISVALQMVSSIKTDGIPTKTPLECTVCPTVITRNIVETNGA